MAKKIGTGWHVQKSCNRSQKDFLGQSQKRSEQGNESPCSLNSVRILRILCARPTATREGENLLFFLGQCRAAKRRGLFFSAQFPETFEFRLQGRDTMCADRGEIIPGIGQSTAQKLQFVSHLRNFLQECGFLYGTHPTHNTAQRRGPTSLFHSLLTSFHLFVMHLTLWLYHLFN